MSSPAAVIGITYRGTDVQDVDGIFLEIYSGLNERVDVRGVDRVVPGSAGQVAYNRRGHRRGIGLRGFVRGSGANEDVQRDDFRANVDVYDSLFDPTLDPGALVLTLEDGTTRSIDARTLPGDIWDQKLPTFASVDVKLESVDPDWVAGS